MSIIESSGLAYRAHLVYIIKCVIGLIICYILYKAIPQYPFYWSIVSVLLAMSPDSSSNSQAYNRIKANILGCAVGIGLYPIHLPELLILCIGVMLAIVLGIALKMTDSLRSALAALVIVTLQSEQSKHWYIALERVMCVVAGCVIALLITLVFSWVLPKRMKMKVLKG